MKKKLTVLILALVCMLMLTGCFCKHEQWKDATCTDPKTCAECGETEGGALGHVWLAATCEAPKTCEVCGVTEGEAKGHDIVEASCTEAKHCTRCTMTEGEALGHQWLDATTEAPQTCSVCAATEGERIITDPRFTTNSVKTLLGKWKASVEMSGEEMGLDVSVTGITLDVFMHFGNAGDLSFSALLSDEDAFWDSIISVYVESMYDEFAAQGLNREEADAAMKQVYGMDVEEYLRSSMEGVNMNDILASVYDQAAISGVYYMKDGKLYSGSNWEGAMTEEPYTLDGDKLVLDSINESLGKDLTFIRVTEE
ncbi:MAG: hypothetical protein IJN20_04035 [Oscillospiraceae bacterium]|nr:hypothetical protein [Oscillospiraceae bacterium]